MNSLKNFRTEINKIDAQIIKLLATRCIICEEVAIYKKAHNISMMQPERIKEVINKSIKLGKDYNISEEFIDKIFTTIINYSCVIEDKLMKDLGSIIFFVVCRRKKRR